jgi:hypothetical protein
MLYFTDSELEAPNVLRVKVDVNIVQELQFLLEEALDPANYHVSIPDWEGDLRWISPNSIQSYKRFQSVFYRLGVPDHVIQYLDMKHTVRMYSGFLVVRSAISEPNFHVDWEETKNQAFTLLTPLPGSAEGAGLLYHKIDGSIEEYIYTQGEAIIFGEDFYHSSKPQVSTRPCALLSFTFGTDKMEYWDQMSNATEQGNLYRLPDGTFFVRDIDTPASG